MIGKLQFDIYRMVSSIYSWSIPRVEGRLKITLEQTILISYIARIYNMANLWLVILYFRRCCVSVFRTGWRIADDIHRPAILSSSHETLMR